MKTKVVVSKVHVFKGHQDCVYALCAHSDKSFFSSGGDGQVILWHLDQLDTARIMAKVSSSVYAMTYNADDDVLCVAQNFEGLHFIKVNERKALGSLKISNHAIFNLLETDQFIFVATAGGEIVVVSKRQMKIYSRLRVSDQNVRTLELINGKLFAGCSDYQVKVLEWPNLKIQEVIPAHQNSVFVVKKSPVLPHFISAGRDAHLKIWDNDTAHLNQDIVAHMYAINDIVFSPDGNYFVTCSMDKSIKVWDSHTYTLKKVIDKARHAGHATSVNKLLWLPYHNFVISCSDDRTISVWDINFSPEVP